MIIIMIIFMIMIIVIIMIIDPLAVADICRCLHNYNGVLQVAGFIIITIVLTVVLIIIVLFSLSSITSLFVSISVLLDQNGRQPLKTIEINGCLTPN